VDDVQQTWRTVAYQGLDDAAQGKTPVEELADSFMQSWVGGKSTGLSSSANSGFVPSSFFMKFVFLDGISPSVHVDSRQRRVKRYKGVKCRFCVEEKIDKLSGTANPWFHGIMVSDLKESLLLAHQKFHQDRPRVRHRIPSGREENHLLLGTPCCDLVMDRGECPETEIVRECYAEYRGAVRKVRAPWAEEGLTASSERLQPKVASFPFSPTSFWNSPEAGSGGSARTNELPAAHQHW
jgi:hypothetical protein